VNYIINISSHKTSDDSSNTLVLSVGIPFFVLVDVLYHLVSDDSSGRRASRRISRTNKTDEEPSTAVKPRKSLSGDPSRPSDAVNQINDGKEKFNVLTESEKIEKLLLDLKLKEADNKFLQDQLESALIQVDKKDKILSMLTEGLKEVYYFI
jgi:hypothetical protein